MHPKTRLVYFYFLRVNFLVKASTSGRCDQVWLPWQRYICRSRYGCFCSFLQVTYLHTKIERGLKFFISNFASLSWRIAPKDDGTPRPILAKFLYLPERFRFIKKKRELRNGVRVSDDLIWEDRQKKKKLRMVMKDAFEAEKRRRFYHRKLYIAGALHQA